MRNVCVARIRPGSPCSLFNNIDPCYGTCTSGRCVAPSNPQSDEPFGVGHPQPPLNEVPEDESCVNLHECCGTWAAKGDCDSKAQIMSTICPASCARCKPAYNVVDICADRHSLCEKYALMGKCKTNQYWMAENCRMQCGFCDKTRKGTCAAQQGPPSHGYKANDAAPSGNTMSQPPSSRKDPCLNSHVCCSYWASQGK
ncbi:hypothetical protein Aduo_018628 [Ancylostoma duodenale]